MRWPASWSRIIDTQTFGSYPTDRITVMTHNLSSLVLICVDHTSIQSIPTSQEKESNQKEFLKVYFTNTKTIILQLNVHCIIIPKGFVFSFFGFFNAIKEENPECLRAKIPQVNRKHLVSSQTSEIQTYLS